MTQEAPESQPTVRLATWIPKPLDQRLRVLAGLRRQTIATALAELLAAALPSADDLAAQVGASEENGGADR